MAFYKETWMVEGRSLKRHVVNQGLPPLAVDAAVQWKRGGDAATAVDGLFNDASGRTKCAIFDSMNSERPSWMVDLGRKMTITGVMVVTRNILETDFGIAVNRRGEYIMNK